MTRIAAGTAALPPSPIDQTVADGAALARATSAVGDVSARACAAPGAAGPDRPAPTSAASAQDRTIDVAALGKELVRWEGNKPFMYLCSAGYVTTGIGNKLGSAREAMALPWQHKTSGLPATPTEIRAAFERVAGMRSEFRGGDPNATNPFAARHYAKATELVLPPGVANQLAIDRLTKDFLPGLRALFPGFDGYPQPAQRALVDMAYTLGVTGLRKKFPRLVEACRNGDFAEAARQSHRRLKANAPREGDARNVATRDLLLEASRLTDSVRTLAREVRP
jgi:GH24 family phage-related lysozyme (muramidase)